MIGLSQGFVGPYSFAILPNTIQNTTSGQGMRDHKIQNVGDEWGGSYSTTTTPVLHISFLFTTQLIAEAFRVGARNNPAPPTFYVQ